MTAHPPTCFTISFPEKNRKKTKFQKSSFLPMAALDEPLTDPGRRQEQGLLAFSNSKAGRKHSCAERTTLIYSRHPIGPARNDEVRVDLEA